MKTETKKITTRKIKSFYATTSDGVLLWVYAEAVVDGTPAYRAIICKLGPTFCGGGMLTGRSIITTDRRAWFQKSSVTRNRKGQNGTIWN